MNPIERWRQRVWDGVHRGTGVGQGRGQRPHHVRRGLRRALDRVGSCTHALLALELLATDLGRLEVILDGRRDSTARGVRLAVFWLRQEIERDLREAAERLQKGGERG